MSGFNQWSQLAAVSSVRDAVLRQVSLSEYANGVAHSNNVLLAGLLREAQETNRLLRLLLQRRG